MYLSDNCDSKCLRCSGSDNRVPFLLPVLFTTQGPIPNHASCGGHECVWFVSPLLSSFVPIISIILDGISIDIPLVILPSYPYSVPTDIDIMDVHLYESMSPQSLRSLHGCCTAVALRKLVPDMQLFRQSVHLLKFFCKVATHHPTNC